MPSISAFSTQFLSPAIDLMHWRHVSITTTPCWGSRIVALRAHVLLAERIGAHPLSQCAHPGQLGGEACRGLPSECMLGDGARGVPRLTPNTTGAPFCDVICIWSIINLWGGGQFSLIHVFSRLKELSLNFLLMMMMMMMMMMIRSISSAPFICEITFCFKYFKVMYLAKYDGKGVLESWSNGRKCTVTIRLHACTWHT